MDIYRGADRPVIASPPALSLRGITKRFGRTVALDGADLEVRAGSLHALLGENGAGKTTLMRLVFGMMRSDAGEMRVEDVVRRWRSSADAIDAGIGMVHQHFMLIPAMTVAENVALNDRGYFRRFDPHVAAERVRKLGTETGLALDPWVRVAQLPVGGQQRLEIVKALARDARILILDEPTAVLAPSESLELYVWLRQFVARGRTVVLITHKLREALAVADDVTVLRQGRTVLAASVHALKEQEVVSALLGGSASTDTRPAERPEARATDDGPVVASLERVTAQDARGVTRLRDVTLAVRAGEILGVAGVEGAGQQELLRIFAGRHVPASGVVTLPDRIGFVQEDRMRDAIIESMTLTENFALKEAGSRGGRMPWASFRARTATVLQDQNVKARGPEAVAATLSGGNQQKFILGRELEGSPALLVVENPVRGLDIRAASQVMQSLQVARGRGVAVVMYSADLDELLAVADRFVVCFGGRVAPVAPDHELLARALMGAS